MNWGFKGFNQADQAAFFDLFPQKYTFQ